MDTKDTGSKAALAVPYSGAMHTFAYRSPRIFAKSFLLNLLGYPVLTSIVWQFVYAVTRAVTRMLNSFDPEAKKISDAMDRDGFYIIKNYLSPAEHEKIRSFFENNTGDFHPQTDIRVPTQTCKLTNYDHQQTDENKRSFAHLFDNSLIRSVAHLQTGLPMKLSPLIYMMKQGWSVVQNAGKATDTSDIYHYDVPYPSIKAIYYVTDTTRDNGAFMIGKGSHRFTLKRLIGEYVYALRSTAPGALRRLDFAGLDGLFSMEETHLEGPANTLALVNVQAVHKRGEFQTSETRRTVFVDFRAAATPANLARVLKSV